MLRGVAEQLVSIFKISKFIILLLLVILLPKISYYYSSSQLSYRANVNSNLKLGLENLSHEFVNNASSSVGRAKVIGLITNQTGRDQLGARNIDLLLKKGINLATIFAVSPGIFDEQSELQGRDEKTGISIVTLYGPSAGRLTEQDIQSLDMLMFDIQDVGMKHHGYVKILLSLMNVAASANKTVVVLDRPNLLGSCMEGLCGGDSKDLAPLNLPVPMRHGMTIGELALYFNKHVLEKPVDLQVVPMENYNRYQQINANLACNISPNIMNVDSCYGYSVLGLLGEVAPFEIGVGTGKAFQSIMLPDSLNFPQKKWVELRLLLKKNGIESKLASQFSPRKKKFFSGVRLMIKDINEFSSVNTLLIVLSFFKKAGVQLSFSSNFDKVIGSAKVRDFLEGKIVKADLEKEINGSLDQFYAKAASSFLYYPLPKVVKV
jgi:uncharacterized protein YbbC (DUF1343 family)